MKIAIIVNSLRFGGAEVQTVELANRLSQNGFDILLICMDNVLAIQERIGADIKLVVADKKIYLDPRALSLVVSHLKAFKPEYVLTVNSFSAMYGYFASFFTRRRYKLINIQHTTMYQGLVDAFQNLYYPFIINRMDKIIFVSKNQMTHWIKKYKINASKASVIYNGINIERFTGFEYNKNINRQKLGFEEDDVILALNANFRPEKKHEDLVMALEILLERGYSAKILFIGDGVRRKPVEEFIEARGLKDKVVITGFVQDVRPYLSCADIAVLTSTSVETLSIAIIESMALGLPAVLSDIGGASELVADGENGYLYPAGDITALAHAIEKIIKNNLFQDMGRISLEKAKKLFDADDMVENYIKAFI